MSGVYSREFNLRRLLGLSCPYDSCNIPVTKTDPGSDGDARTVLFTGARAMASIVLPIEPLGASRYPALIIPSRVAVFGLTYAF